jgi:hypothetical protein
MMEVIPLERTTPENNPPVLNIHSVIEKNDIEHDSFLFNQYFHYDQDIYQRNEESHSFFFDKYDQDIE